MLSKFTHWLPLALVATLLCGLVYGSVQQVLRQGANDPQIEESEYLADYFSSRTFSEALDEFHWGPEIDIRTSLRPFTMVFNEEGNLVGTNLNLDQLHKETNQTISVPRGVFDYAKSHRQNRLTWEPLPGVREATVVTYFQGKSSGFILVGRSLREVEKREDKLQWQVGLAWVVTLFSSLFASILFHHLKIG